MMNKSNVFLIKKKVRELLRTIKYQFVLGFFKQFVLKIVILLAMITTLNGQQMKRLLINRKCGKLNASPHRMLGSNLFYSGKTELLKKSTHYLRSSGKTRIKSERYNCFQQENSEKKLHQLAI